MYVYIYIYMQARNTWVMMVEERKRLRVVAGKVVGRWKHMLRGQSFMRWYEQIVRTRRALKAAKMWLKRAMGRACNAWVLMVEERKRLRVVAGKVVGKWKHRLMAHAWSTWYELHQELLRLKLLSSKVVLR